MASGRTATRVEVTSVVSVEGVDEQLLTRLTSVIGGVVSSGGTGRERLRVETMYDYERATAKVIVVGGASDVARVLTLIGSFSEVDL